MTKVRARTVSHEFVEITLDDGNTVEIPVRLAPGDFMSGYDYEVEWVTPNLVVVGYLDHDQDCSNPIEDSDGNGRIWQTTRRAGREHHHNAQEALALDENWSPDYRYDEVDAELTRMFPDTDSDDLTREQLQAAWEKCREEGKIGEPLAVMLDCFEHGNQSWSVSGTGMQCQWDTSRNAGVWVPDDSAREDIKSSAPDRALGIKVKHAGNESDPNRAVATLADGREFVGEGSGGYGRALIAAREALGGKTATPEEIKRAEHEIAVEYATSACQEYTAWVNGDCYGVIVVTAKRDGPEDEFEMVESDEVWGHVGSDWAQEAMKDNVQSTAKYLANEKGETNATE